VTFLLLNQCFYPDVMATAQQLATLAEELVSRGHKVTVIATDRGYDDPSRRFCRRENWNGVTIIRLPSVIAGKRTKWRRLFGFAGFLIICAFRLLFLPRFDVVVTLTSPPLISVLGALFVQAKGGRFFCWVMDLNPDEAIAAGWIKQDSFAARALQRLLSYSLRRAEKVIVLDRFMKQRILAKGTPENRIVVLPPWALNHKIHYDGPGRAAFRQHHHLEDRFVVMYSGNHSPCHPLDTLLQAAAALSAQTQIAFCFVGGGTEQAKVRSFAASNNLQNISCLPYQPLDELAGSLSAGDLQAVVMGDKFAGIIHPCKIYNIISVGVPLLYIGPKESHIMDIASQNWHGYKIYEARHGDAQSVAASILGAATDQNHRAKMPQEFGDLARHFSRESLLPRLVQLLETGDKGKDD